MKLGIGNAGNLFDQAKFYAGLGIFLYAVWGLASKRAEYYGFDVPGPDVLPDFEAITGFGYPGGRATANCDEARNRCTCPNGDRFQMGPARTCKDCVKECAKRAKTAKANLAGAYFYGRPWRDAALPWQPSNFAGNDPRERLTVA